MRACLQYERHAAGGLSSNDMARCWRGVASWIKSARAGTLIRTYCLRGRQHRVPQSAGCWLPALRAYIA